MTASNEIKAAITLKNVRKLAHFVETSIDARSLGSRQIVLLPLIQSGWLEGIKYLYETRHWVFEEKEYRRSLGAVGNSKSGRAVFDYLINKIPEPLIPWQTIIQMESRNGDYHGLASLAQTKAIPSSFFCSAISVLYRHGEFDLVRQLLLKEAKGRMFDDGAYARDFLSQVLCYDESTKLMKLLFENSTLRPIFTNNKLMKFRELVEQMYGGFATRRGALLYMMALPFMEPFLERVDWDYCLERACLHPWYDMAYFAVQRGAVPSLDMITKNAILYYEGTEKDFSSAYCDRAAKTLEILLKAEKSPWREVVKIPAVKGIARFFGEERSEEGQFMLTKLFRLSV